MQLQPPNQSVAGKPRSPQRLAWRFMLLLGAAIVAGEVVAIVAALSSNSDTGLFPFLLPVLICIALYFCLKAAFDPVRQRPDARPLWKERFPTHSVQEIQRFLRTVGEALGFQASDWGKLRPAEELSAVKHRWLGVDGMELVELTLTVEREYFLDLSEEFLGTNKTLGELFAYVTRPAASHALRQNLCWTLAGFGAGIGSAATQQMQTATPQQSALLRRGICRLSICFWPAVPSQPRNCFPSLLMLVGWRSSSSAWGLVWA